jgi:hypothetical protein|nr:MAG TPA: hypothetical protein [Caudoviricetes sp.]
MNEKRIIKVRYNKFKADKTEAVYSLKLWCTYINSWGDRFFIATQRTDGLFVGYTYANPQPSMFTEEGKFVGYIDCNGVEHLMKRSEDFDLDVLEAEFKPWEM